VQEVTDIAADVERQNEIVNVETVVGRVAGVGERRTVGRHRTDRNGCRAGARGQQQHRQHGRGGEFHLMHGGFPPIVRRTKTMACAVDGRNQPAVGP
jgi:hypothetical protein